MFSHQIEQSNQDKPRGLYTRDLSLQFHVKK